MPHPQSSSKILRLGTRGSALALYQANRVKEALEKTCIDQSLPYRFEIVDIKTTGDKVLDRRLSEIGGKALFTKEIDQALLDNHIDMGIHSMKDCETWLDEAITVAAILEREDPRDVLVSRDHLTLEALPLRAKIGTCSLRRTSQILHLRPDLQPVLFRGNVQTRLAKIDAGEADATLFALAGLKRLKLQDHIAQIFEPHEMTPCAAQGAIGVAHLKERSDLTTLLNHINNPQAAEVNRLERLFLAYIDGHCGTPVGLLLTPQQDTSIHGIACVATTDGKDLWRDEFHVPKDQIEAHLEHLGKAMKVWLNERGL